MNEADITRPASGVALLRAEFPSGSLVFAGCLLAGLAAVVFWFSSLLPASQLSDDVLPDAFRLVAYGGLFCLSLLAVLASKLSRAIERREVAFRLALVIWWFVLACDEYFRRSRIVGWEVADTSLQGDFSAAAYDEAIFWILAFLALLVISLPHFGYLRRIFAGSSKWPSLYALVCLASAGLSPVPKFSLAWAFKLCLVVLLLHLMGSVMREVNQIRLFFQATFWAAMFLTAGPLVSMLLHPRGAFEEGRVGAAIIHPPELAALGANLLLLSLLMGSLAKRKFWPAFGVLLGITAMILSGGKAGIAAGLLSATFFFVCQGKVGRGLGLLGGISLFAGILVLSTPLGGYLELYSRSGEVSTLTGRTDLWATAWPAILRHPVIGHGYASSKFVEYELRDINFTAGHLHNEFLEALYNNGLIGLVLILAMHLVILRNLFALVRRPPGREAYLLAIGSLSLYLNLLVNSLVEANAGGRLRSDFMIFLAVMVVSEVLRRATLPRFGAAAKEASSPAAEIAGG